MVADSRPLRRLVFRKYKSSSAHLPNAYPPCRLFISLRHIAPKSGKHFFLAGRAVNDDELRFLQTAGGQIVHHCPARRLAFALRFLQRK